MENEMNCGKLPFNLSDKQMYPIIQMDGKAIRKDFVGERGYMESDVKEFIRLLKEEIRGIPPIIKDDEYYQDSEEISKRIDKLAGEALI